MPVEAVGFLACGWSLASNDAHGQAIAVKQGSDVILVDAGGEVAKGLMRTFGTDNLSEIYLTHEHPDHTWGLIGLIHHLRFDGPREELTIHGPKPALNRCQAGLEALGVTYPFKIHWEPIDASENGQDGTLEWAPMNHSVPTVGYRIEDVVICGDTKPTEAIVELADGASLLVHEASHTDEQLTHESGHSTPSDAGQIATRAAVDKLALIHIHPSLGRPQAIQGCPFPNTVAPKDGDILHHAGDDWSLD